MQRIEIAVSVGALSNGKLFGTHTFEQWVPDSDRWYLTWKYCSIGKQVSVVSKDDNVWLGCVINRGK